MTGPEAAAVGEDEEQEEEGEGEDAAATVVVAAAEEEEEEPERRCRCKLEPSRSNLRARASRPAFGALCLSPFLAPGPRRPRALPVPQCEGQRARPAPLLPPPRTGGDAGAAFTLSVVF